MRSPTISRSRIPLISPGFSASRPARHRTSFGRRAADRGRNPRVPQDAAPVEYGACDLDYGAGRCSVAFLQRGFVWSKGTGHLTRAIGLKTKNPARCPARALNAVLDRAPLLQDSGNASQE